MPFIGNSPYQVAFLTDTFSGNGSTTAFTMSVAPANTSSVLVAVSGVLQDPSTYSVSGTTLTFSAAPPTGTGNISARYLGIPASGVTTTAYRTVTEFTATANQKTFTPPSYTVGFISVYRNGVMLGSADYTATNGTTVVLALGATAGDLVTVESFLVSSVLNAIPATGGTIGGNLIVNSATGQTPLQVQTNGTTTAIVDSSGNAGIGTASPAYKLDVYGAGNSTVGHFYTPSGQSAIRVETAGNDKAVTEYYTNGNGNWRTGPGITTAGAFEFNSVTANATRMSITSTGAVTKPYQPAFFASGTGGTLSFTPGSYIPFNTLYTTFAGSNRNSGYNTGTYLYTAPVAGLYFFYTQMYLNPNSTTSSFTWWKNGTQLYYADAANNVFMATNSSSTPSNIVLTGSVTIELAAGDTVGIQVRTGFGTAQIYMGHSSFFGYLIG